MARDDPKFMLRLPAELKARIERAAKAAGRSINAEIVHQLEEGYAPLGQGNTGLATAFAVLELISQEGGTLAADWQRIRQKIPPDFRDSPSEAHRIAGAAMLGAAIVPKDRNPLRALADILDGLKLPAASSEDEAIPTSERAPGTRKPKT